MSKPADAPKSNLTSDIAEKVLLADLANILKKAKSGKPLTSYERTLIAKHKEEAEKIEAEQKPKAGRGRPRSTAAVLPIYDSIQQAHAATGIPISWFKEAKRAGCDAFRSNRVDLGRFLRWLGSSEADESNIDWNQELAKEKAKRERNKRLKEDRILIDKSEADQAISAGLGLLFTELDRTFLCELPADDVGKDEIGIRKNHATSIEELREKLRVKFVSTGEAGAAAA